VTIIPVGKLDRWQRKAVAAAVARDSFATFRAMVPVQALNDSDLYVFCKLVAGRAADAMAIAHRMPLGDGRWSLDTSDMPTTRASHLFAMRFLTAAANLDDAEQRRLWDEQVRFSRVAYSSARERGVLRDAVTALVGWAAEVYRAHGVTP